MLRLAWHAAPKQQANGKEVDFKVNQKTWNRLILLSIELCHSHGRVGAGNCGRAEIVATIQ